MPKKNKLAGALFAGVVKKSKDSDDSDSESSSSSDKDSDEEEKIKTKKKKKQNKKQIDANLLEDQPQTKANADELFDLGDENEIDPYKMMSSSNNKEDLLDIDNQNNK